MEVFKPLHKIPYKLWLLRCIPDPLPKITDFISWIVMRGPEFRGSLQVFCFRHFCRKAITILPFKILFHCETPYSVVCPFNISAVITLQIIVHIPFILLSFILRGRFPFMLMRFLFVPSLALISSYRLSLFTSIICACSWCFAFFFFIIFMYITCNCLFCLERIRIGQHKGSSYQVNEKAQLQ